jgi:hypothetical protein
MPQVGRDADNSHTKSKYARLETLSAAMTPVLTKHGFSISFGTADSPLPGHYRITAEVSHEAGHSRTYQADIPADLGGAKGAANKSATHAFGSTMSYGRRYLKMLIFDVVTKGEDDDGNGGPSHPPVPEFVSADQLSYLRRLIDKVDADEAKFCRYLRIRDLPSLPAPADGIAPLRGGRQNAERGMGCLASRHHGRARRGAPQRSGGGSLRQPCDALGDGSAARRDGRL